MGMTTYRVSTATMAPASALASVDIQFDGEIRGILYTGAVTPGAAAECGQRAQLSFGSSLVTTSVNDSRQVLCDVAIAASASYAAVANSAAENVYIPTELPVKAGERIFLHTAALGTQPTTGSHTFLLFVSDKSSGNMSRR